MRRKYWSFQRVRRDAAHGLRGLGEVGGLAGVVVIEVGDRPGRCRRRGRRRGDRSCRQVCDGGEPVVGVGEMLADAEAEAALAGGLAPTVADDVLLGAGGHGVPARLVFGVPQVEVVVVDAHAKEVLCAGL